MKTLASTLPLLSPPAALTGGIRRAYIGAFGFEDRSLGWSKSQCAGDTLAAAFVFRYLSPKGPNRVEELKRNLRQLGAKPITSVPYDIERPQVLEETFASIVSVDEFDEVVVDTSAMTKLAILLVLSELQSFDGSVRIIYSEAEEYCPSQAEYDPVKGQMAATARYPSRGAEQVVRLRCLSSIRMQGQPLTLIAFASFNEKLISHMLGSISPHRLILVNSRPPRADYAWRERATHDIHKRLIAEYDLDNPVGANGLLLRSASTLDYRESLLQLEELYEEHGRFERIVCAATGSKMQTVGSLFFKIRHPDVQVEYPTPDSYFITDLTHGVRCVHELVIPRFASFAEELRCVKVKVDNATSAGVAA